MRQWALADLDRPLIVTYCLLIPTGRKWLNLWTNSHLLSLLRIRIPSQNTQCHVDDALCLKFGTLKVSSRYNVFLSTLPEKHWFSPAKTVRKQSHWRGLCSQPILAVEVGPFLTLWLGHQTVQRIQLRQDAWWYTTHLHELRSTGCGTPVFQSLFGFLNLEELLQAIRRDTLSRRILSAQSCLLISYIWCPP